MRRTAVHRPSQVGFTLVELLCAVAIVGLLAAILLPAFHTARDKARRSVCTSNLHQIGLAVTAYRGDWDGSPLAVPMLAQYARAQALFMCAADPLSEVGGTGRCWWARAHGAATGSYSYCYYPVLGRRAWDWFSRNRRAGFMVDILHADVVSPGGSLSGAGVPTPPYYQGRYLRLRTDASVVVVECRWEPLNSWDSFRIHTDIPVDQYPPELKGGR